MPGPSMIRSPAFLGDSKSVCDLVSPADIPLRRGVDKGHVKTKNKGAGLMAGALSVAGAGFEPATFGL